MPDINYRKILNSHREEIEALKSDLTSTQTELSNLTNKYQFLLEKMLELNGNSKPKTPVSKPLASTFAISDFQLLLVLFDAQATSQNYAVTAIQLKAAYNIQKSERTIRNKLSELEHLNYILTISGRPKRYFLSKNGIDYVEKQKRESLSFGYD
jgi:uncharacterized coiled-coil protein SlyX